MLVFTLAAPELLRTALETVADRASRPAYSLPEVSAIDVPQWLDLLTIAVGALAGALFASVRRVPVTGVLLIAVATGLGGGLVRDLLLAVGAPRAISDPRYLPTAAIAALTGMVLSRWRPPGLHWPLLLVDSVSLGLFAVIGITRSLQLGYPPASAVFIGVLAACAGGVIRDLLVGEAPAIMKEGPWDASAVLTGGALMVLLVTSFGVSAELLQWPTIAVIALLATLSVKLGWRSPLVADLHPVLEVPVELATRAADNVRRTINPRQPDPATPAADATGARREPPGPREG
ncbi:MAG: trimeric intracellular cation channel family protein [Candidatus Nanopelagicales bacterium]